MFNHQSSRIWKRTLAVQKGRDCHAQQRELLRTSLESFRTKASMLASEIPLQLREYTVHDVSHLDSLWEMVDIVTDDQFLLNPAEAYVLGGSILTHDLGLALAAYPDGLDELKQDVFWSDTVVSLYQETLNREPTPEEIAAPLKEIEASATGILLRHFHAKRAESLALISWQSKSNPGEGYYLISDEALRGTYGTIIGKLAHSHWWSVEELVSRLGNKKGPATFLPTEWDIDVIKIACLLRVADAIHVDDRRAPDFLWAVRELSEESNRHWNFQNKLLKPVVSDSNRLLYSTKSPFDVAEAEAWWLCYDSLKLIDSELNRVDSLLGESGRQRLTAFGVEGVNSPRNLSRHIETYGWEPLDTRIRIGNVAKLVERFGGTELYGNDPLIPLRELIQNSCDAIRARRLLESHPSTWGDITVEEGTDESGYFVQIEDNGVGMSQNVMRGPFLDFGQSFWGSYLMLEELPGLKSRKFESTGKYGIGFFSIFMWGDKATVLSRKYDQSAQETWCLEFRGLDVRPLMRRANKEERIPNGGTQITVWFRDKRHLRDIVYGFTKLNEMCRYAAPSIDANLHVKHKAVKGKVIGANDWLKIAPSRLIDRVSNSLIPVTKSGQEKNLGKTTTVIHNSKGSVVGRGFLSRIYNYPGFAVTVHGIRQGSDLDPLRENSGTFHGIVEGNALNVARNRSLTVLSQHDLDAWATNQVKKIGELPIFGKERVWYCLSAISLGGDPLDLPFAAERSNRKIRFLNYSKIVRKFRKKQCCVIKNIDFFEYRLEDFLSEKFAIHIDTYNYGQQRILDQIENYDHGRNFTRNTGLFWVEKALSEAWGVQKLDIRYFDGDDFDSAPTTKRLASELKIVGITFDSKRRPSEVRLHDFIAIAKRN